MQVHIIVQSKGGVGKSYISSMLVQYLSERFPSISFDTDPENATLKMHRGLEVKFINLIDGETGKINEAAFDELVMDIYNADDTIQHAIVDTGASTFRPLLEYLRNNQILEVLKEKGHDVILHVVIAGGSEILSTVQSYETIATTLPDAMIVPWINEFAGDAKIEGKTFEDSKTFKAYGAGNPCPVVISAAARRHPETFGAALERMGKLKLSLKDAIASEKFNVLDKRRLSIVRDDTWTKIAEMLVEIDTILKKKNGTAKAG